MNIKIIDKNGVTLKTKGKYCREDISVAVDESLMGITPSGTYEVTNNGEYDITQYAKVNVNVASSGGESTLKKLLDYTKSTSFMFNSLTVSTLDNYINYSDTENVTTMNNMYASCTSLIKTPLLDTRNVKKMSRIFAGCTALIEIRPLNTSNVTDMGYMFNGCSALTKAPQLDTSKVTDISYMYYNCNKLQTIDITYYKSSSSSFSNNWCCNCYSLKAVIIRNFGTSYTLNSNAFSECYHLTGTVNSTYNPNGDKDCYFYIPRQYINNLKSKTNWSTYADQMRILEDYTVDGTTTGELDESKI